MFKQTLPIKTEEHIENIRESGRYLTELLGQLYALSKPGMTTMELEVYTEKYLMTNNLVGAFKGYGGFPTNLCTSVNDCVVHGVPDAVPLQHGDVLKVDCGINYKGGISDAAFSIVIGGDEKNPEGARLIKATKKMLDESIQVIAPGVLGRRFGRKAKEVSDAENIAVIKNLTGHGVGSDVHEAPHIYNWPQNSMKKRSFETGMVCAIEPITSLYSESYTEKKGIQHNLYTSEGDVGAQREYTILVTKSGFEVLAGLQ